MDEHQAQISHAIIPAQIFADDDEAHGGESDSSGGRNLDPPLAVEEPKQKAKDIDMQPAENAETRTTKRNIDGAPKNAGDGDGGIGGEANKSAADERDALIHKLMERLAQKDDLIASMLTKIDNLQTKLETLSGLTMQKHSERSVASTEPNDL